MKSRVLRQHPSSPLEGQSLTVKECWDFTLNKGEVLAPHLHTEVEEVYIVLEGYGVMVVGEKKMTVSAGDVIFIPLKAVHFISNPEDKPLRCLTIVCRATKISAQVLFGNN